MKTFSGIKKNYRNLTPAEVVQLEKQQNISQNWDNIYVSDIFDPLLVRNCHFSGENYIADLAKEEISFGNLSLETGLYNTTLRDCQIQKNAAVHNVAYLSNYLVGEGSILFNINEISCSKNPSFGNGFDKADRNWIKLANENGGRKILPFATILPADAYLWSKYRQDAELLAQLEKFTDKLKQNNDLDHGTIGSNCLIKNVKSIEDCNIGACCIIDSASRLKNCTILSSVDEPGMIGVDVELVDGIIGYGNTCTSAAKCFNFITGRNVKIELGARIRHTFIGCNSTIACCEVLNNLIFPFHEQHHNNSFLIAATVMGQANIAAGATIGSNHNSRAADGEIEARRGFWPGLETDFKYNASFASFTLIAKGSYETELNISLPFSLVSKDKTAKLQIFPAFWLRYNMYALARNAWKFKARDKRKIKDQHIETNFLAPDTLFEALLAIHILEEALKKSPDGLPEIDLFSFRKIDDLQNITLKGIAPKENVSVIKPLQALWIYKNLLMYAAAREIVIYFQKNPVDIKQLFNKIPQTASWSNLGGQLVSFNDTRQLIADIKNQKINSWDDLHNRYDILWTQYPQQKRRFTLACWLELENSTVKDITDSKIKKLIEHSIKFNNALLKWTIEARKKDYDNPFRQLTYSNNKEMAAVCGLFEDDTFIKEMKKENQEYLQLANLVLSKI